jgi:signal transduction protein with GAF and PtsI domain
MARYIDADKLIAHLKDEIEGCKQPFGTRANGKSVAYGTALGLKSAISFAETLATADVVPKSEVDWHREAELNAQRIMELEAEKDALIKNYAECMKDYAKQIFEEIDELLHQNATMQIATSTLHCKLAELKKKYTKESEGKE